MASQKNLRFYHIISYTDPNPIVLATSAREAGEKYCQKFRMDYEYVTQEELYCSKAEIGKETACFAENSTIPERLAEKNTVEYQKQIDNMHCFYVELVCLDKKPCAECKDYENSGFNLVIKEDIKLIESALAHRAAVKNLLSLS